MSGMRQSHKHKNMTNWNQIWYHFYHQFPHFIIILSSLGDFWIFITKTVVVRYLHSYLYELSTYTTKYAHTPN